MKIVRGTANYTVPMLGARLVNIKIIFEAVKVIYLVADRKFVYVVFDFAGGYIVYAAQNSSTNADTFFYAQRFCGMLHRFSVLFLNGKYYIVLIITVITPSQLLSKSIAGNPETAKGTEYTAIPIHAMTKGGISS